MNAKAPPEAPEYYEENSPLLSKHLELRGGFAGAMRETRICVVSSPNPLLPPFEMARQALIFDFVLAVRRFVGEEVD